MMKDRTQQAGIITIAEFTRFGIKSVIGIVLARLITPAELGSYRQLFLIYTTFSTLMMLGIPQSLLYFLPKLASDEERRQHVGKIMNLSLVLSIVFALGLLGFRGLIASKFSNPQLGFLLLVYAIYPVFMFSSSLYSYVMLGQGDAIASARFTLFSVATDAILILGTALWTRDLKLIVTGVIAAAFFQWLYTRVKLQRYRASFRLDPSFYKKQFAYALPLGLSSIVGMLSIQLDKFVISGFFDPASFAIFSVGAMELPFISILTNSVNSVLLPGISAQSDKTKMSEVFRAAVRKNALFIFPVALICYLFAPQIITLLYTDVYRGAIPFFRIYLGILPLRVATFGIIFMAIGKTRVILFNSIFTLICNLVLNLVLVRQYGMMGAAVATVIMTAISVLLYIGLVRWKYGFIIGRLIPSLALVKTALAVLLAGLACWSMLSVTNSAGMQLLAVFIFGSVYLVVAYLIGALLPYDLRTALDFVKGLMAKVLGSRAK